MKVLGMACLAVALMFLFGCAASQQAPQPSPAPANVAAPSATELAAFPAHLPMHLTTCPYGGIWNSDYGIINITQTGSMVVGIGPNASETINGTVIDGVFVGTWSEPFSPSEPNDTGDEAFYFANDCNSFHGAWSYGQHVPGAAWNGTWGGTRAPASPQPAAPSATAVPAHLAACPYGGIWSSDWGAMNLTQTGSTVTGTYEHDSGRLNGTVTDGVFTGTWSESPSYSGLNDAGDAVLYFTDGCNSFSGTWNYGQHAPGAAWSGIWVGAKGPHGDAILISDLESINLGAGDVPSGAVLDEKQSGLVTNALQYSDGDENNAGEITAAGWLANNAVSYEIKNESGMTMKTIWSGLSVYKQNSNASCFLEEDRALYPENNYTILPLLEKHGMDCLIASATKPDAKFGSNTTYIAECNKYNVFVNMQVDWVGGAANQLEVEHYLDRIEQNMDGLCKGTCQGAPKCA